MGLVGGYQSLSHLGHGPGSALGQSWPKAVTLPWFFSGPGVMGLAVCVSGYFPEIVSTSKKPDSAGPLPGVSGNVGGK